MPFNDGLHSGIPPSAAAPASENLTSCTRPAGGQACWTTDTIQLLVGQSLRKGGMPFLSLAWQITAAVHTSQRQPAVNCHTITHTGVPLLAVVVLRGLYDHPAQLRHDHGTLMCTRACQKNSPRLRYAGTAKVTTAVTTSAATMGTATGASTSPAAAPQQCKQHNAP